MANEMQKNATAPLWYWRLLRRIFLASMTACASDAKSCYLLNDLLEGQSVTICATLFEASFFIPDDILDILWLRHGLRLRLERLKWLIFPIARVHFDLRNQTLIYLALFPEGIFPYQIIHGTAVGGLD